MYLCDGLRNGTGTRDMRKAEGTDQRLCQELNRGFPSWLRQRLASVPEIHLFSWPHGQAQVFRFLYNLV